MDLLFNIGPSGSTSAIYISLDAYYMPISQNIVTVNPNELIILMVPVPEPGAMMLCMFGLVFAKFF